MPEVVSLDDPKEAYLNTFPCPVHALGPGMGSYHYSARLIPWLIEHASDYQGFILDGIWSYSSFGAYQALRRVNRPYIVFTHGMLDPYFNQFPLKRLKKMLYWPWSEYRVLRDAKTVCFTTDEERILARQSFSPYRCKETVVNFGTAGPSRLEEDQVRQIKTFYEEFPQLKYKRFLLFLSRIHPKKGCDLLIEAWGKLASQYPDIDLVIAGPDQIGWRSTLEKRAHAMGISERIIWTGMLQGDLKWGAFLAAEAFILPSHQENFGIVVAESLACNTPVLLTDKVNIWREVTADNAGLVASDTVDGITDLMQRWLVLPELKRQEMKRQALRCFLNRFEIQRAAESLLSALFDQSFISSGVNDASSTAENSM